MPDASAILITVYHRCSECNNYHSCRHFESEEELRSVLENRVTDLLIRREVEKLIEVDEVIEFVNDRERFEYMYNTTLIKTDGELINGVYGYLEVDEDSVSIRSFPSPLLIIRRGDKIGIASLLATPYFKRIIKFAEEVTKKLLEEHDVRDLLMSDDFE